MKNEVTGSGRKIRVPIIIDGEEVTAAVINPHSPLIMRDIANVVKLLNTGMPDGMDISDEDLAALEQGDIDVKLDAIKRTSEPLIKAADFIDDVIRVCDKLFGAGVTEMILANDNESLELLCKTCDVVAREVKAARKGLTDKYRA